MQDYRNKRRLRKTRRVRENKMEFTIKPLKLSGNVSENWQIWLANFKNYLVASETYLKDEKIQCARLLHFMGENALQINNTLKISDKEKDNLQVLIQKFDNYFTPKRNLVYERYKFFTYKQTNEATDQYITELKTKAKSCEFKTLEEDLIKTQLIIGIRNNILREKLLEQNDMKLDKVIEQCSVFEMTKVQSADIKENVVYGVEKNRQETTNRYQKKQFQNKSSNKPEKIIKDCTKCGKNHPINKCPAYGKKCNKCKKINHFSNVCKSKNVNIIENDIETKSNNLAIDSIYTVNTIVNDEDWYIDLKINKNNIKFKIDSGSKVNTISKHILEKINPNLINKINASNEKLLTYTNEVIMTIGKINLETNYKNNTYTLDYFITEKAFQPILSLKSSIKLNLIKRIEEIKQTDNIIEKFTDVFEGIGNITQPYHINLKPNTKPVVQPIRKVPFALQDKLKEHLNNLEKNKIIKKVEGSSAWVNALVIIRKPDNSLRICLDPKPLNEAIIQNTFKIPTIDEIAVKLNNSKVFTTLDATSGFWNIPLDEESSNLCTFGTPFGRYKFLRMPYGIKIASEVFQQKFKEIFNLEGVEIYIDDILIHGKTQEEHDERLEKVFQIARKYNIKFNKKKCSFSKGEVNYLGYKFSSKGIEMQSDRITAIKEMPTPLNKKDVQRFLGMVNYCGKFIENLSEKTKNLRNLVKKQNIFSWEKVHEEEFNELKEILSKEPCLKYYDPEETTTISVDASQAGLGAVLLQKGRPCAFASKTMTETQTRYAQIEKELLAICFGVDKFYQYVYGKTFHVETDHKPLIAIFKKPLNECPARLQRMLLQLQKYNFIITYKPGKMLIIPDGLSRATTKEIYEDKMELEAHVCIVTESIDITDNRLKQIVEETKKDEELKIVLKFINTKWPQNHTKIPNSAKQYYKIKNDLTEHKGIIFYKQKIVIPKSMRNLILEKIHIGHPGINKSIQRANTAVYWPGINSQIENLVNKCKMCQIYSNSLPKEPIINHEIYSTPWYKVGIDIFEFKNEYYLIAVDYYSKYVEMMSLNKNMTANTVINKLKSIFARHGIPAIVMTDNGPQFTSEEFKNFSKQWNFEHKTSSPYHQQSNGQAERTIQTIKNIMKKAENKDDIYLALLAYRNTPIKNSFTPSQILMSRMLRDNIPRTNLNPEKINTEKFVEKIKEDQNKNKTQYNKNTKVKPQLREGERVYVQKTPKSTWEPGNITKKLNDRTYIIKTDDDAQITRNSKYIKINKTNSHLVTLTKNNYKTYTRPKRNIIKPNKLNL